jgi:hypothetical protein
MKVQQQLEPEPNIIHFNFRTGINPCLIGTVRAEAWLTTASPQTRTDSLCADHLVTIRDGLPHRISFKHGCACRSSCVLASAAPGKPCRSSAQSCKQPETSQNSKNPIRARHPLELTSWWKGLGQFRPVTHQGASVTGQVHLAGETPPCSGP